MPRHHPQINVESLLAHNFAGDPWYRHSGFALKAGCAESFCTAARLAQFPYGENTFMTFAGADWSLEWPGYVEGGLVAGLKAADIIHKHFYIEPPSKGYNPTKRLVREHMIKRQDCWNKWDGDVVKEIST